MTTADIHSTTLDIALQAAREAVAKRHFVTGWQDIGAEIRDGQHDNNKSVSDALLGADAAHAAVLEAVVQHLDRRAPQEEALGHYTEAHGYRTAAAELRRLATTEGGST